jgi:nucleoid DNA-binding protein
MAAKPMSKTKIVSHIAEKVGTPKKTAALFFEELFKLAV